MPLSRRLATLLTVSAAPLLLACGSGAEPSGGGHVAVSVKPLTLNGVGNAFYTVRVYAADPRLGAAPLVAEVTSVDADRFGDGVGAISYIAPCDASVATNFVEVVLDELRDANDALIDASTWQNPTPLVREAACLENRDTSVVFNITIMRDANQGFFDIAVNFSDVFCSAKFDCRDENNDPMKLLHNAAGERDTTMVLGFACTAGEGQTTWLHMSDVYVQCDPDGDGGDPPASYWVTPVGAGGNHGAVTPVFFQTALYMGEEQLEPYDKCYWNMAFGVSDDAPGNCKLIVDATASEASWLADDGRTPRDTVYPYVHFEVPFTNGEGELACGKHAMNAADGVVTTSYTGFGGSSFPFEWQCGEEPPVETGRVACDGSVAALGSAGAVFTQTHGGVSVAFGASRTQNYALAGDLQVGDCCLNPCCSEP